MTFSISVEKELDNGKPIKYKKRLSIALDLCQAHCQILLIILVIDFIVISTQIVNLILTICQSKMIN